jgi:hypothetical protein
VTDTQVDSTYSCDMKVDAIVFKYVIKLVTFDTDSTNWPNGNSLDSCWRFSVQISAGISIILTVVFRGFLQPLKKNKIVRRLGYGRFFSNYFQIFTDLVFIHSKLRLATGRVVK